jgi:hypothetical protein
MEKEKNKIKLGKQSLFQGAIAVSGLLLAFGIFNITEITQTNSSIDMLEVRIAKQKQENQEALEEIARIEEEFANAEKSSPLDIDGRIHLIVRNIKRLINSYDISSEITHNSGGPSSKGVPTASVDSETGLRTISFTVSLEYNRYSDAKKVIKDLRDTFPITIDKVVFSDRDATFNFTMYGN